MPVRVEVPYEKTFLSKHPLQEAFDYFSDVEKSVPGNFPGVEGFEESGQRHLPLGFEKVGYSGYEIQIRLVTRFQRTAPHRIDVSPVAEPGACLFTGGWELKDRAGQTEVTFRVHFVIDIPVPGFLKGMAVPLASKELTKLFDRYVARVEKNFG